MRKRMYVSALLLCLFLPVARSQEVALKTNLLYDATATINLGIEAGVAPRWTLELSGNLNAWTLSDDKKWKHWLIQPEARYWFCDRFSGHFLGVHFLGGKYNVGGFNGHLHFLGTDLRKFAEHRYQGWFVGAGVAYGYDWILGRHWNLEAEIGLGYAYTKFDRYNCAGCGRKTLSDRHHNYYGPTKAAINLVYLF